MNLQERKTLITEMCLGDNLTYILGDSGLFLTTEYKVMHSQKDDCLVKCMKMLFNDKIQLFYLTDDLKAFSSLVSLADADGLRLLVNNLLANIVNIKANGFLCCENIDIAFEHIFVDPATYKVFLVYLPISKRWFDDYSSFENELRASLLNMISGLPLALCSQQINSLISDLKNRRLTLDDIYTHIKSADEKLPRYDDQTSYATAPVLHLVSINTLEQLEFVIDKDEYTIGKNAAAVDGVISFNNTISRKHCVIKRSEGQFTISDLISSNGTFVNGARVGPNQQLPIRNGDIVRLSNSSFKAEIR